MHCVWLNLWPVVMCRRENRVNFKVEHAYLKTKKCDRAFVCRLHVVRSVLILLIFIISLMNSTAGIQRGE